ncbi:SLBB domain-containing protein [Puniceicoccaceae bacterium K14]|nr:SLBB domain-containing protein [Puniceicoccaceae bacterium K14]
MKTSSKTDIAWMKCAFALAASFLLVGCQSRIVSTGKGPYSWVQSAHEEVGTVPVENVGNKAPLVTPTSKSYVSDALPWGSPKNLTNPVGKKLATKKNDSAREETKEGKGGSGYGRSVIVNINSNEEKEEDADTVGQEESSRLEDLYRGNIERKASRDLEQFGYAFFENGVDTSSTIGPIPSSYVLGPGDEVLISLTGGVEAFHRLVIDRDGILSVPEFGQIPLANQTYEDLYDALVSFMQETRRGFELSVSLGKLRVIQVNVVGQVNQPGQVEVPALATPLTALVAAGGPRKDGSLRSVSVRRNEGGEQRLIQIDLYDFLNGPESQLSNLSLREGDTIIVPTIGATVGIAGYVQKPGIYELLGDKTTVADAIEYAGGLTPFSFMPLASLERTVNGRGRERIDVELTEETMTLEMGNGELLMIEAVDDARQPLVHIEGEVARPGEFQFQVGMKISDLVKRADGLTVNAYLPQAIISRQLGDSSEIELVPGRRSQSNTRRVLVVDLGKAISGDATHDIELHPLDYVTVRSILEAQERAEVEIIGSVQRPGVYELTAGMRVSDLIAVANNLKQEVYYDQAELIRRVFDERTKRLDVRRYRFDLRSALDSENAYSDTNNPLLASGDRLVIRELQQAQVRVKIGGRVPFPGEYIFPAGANISDLVAAAGGILSDADLRAAIFTRESTKNLQQKRMNHLTERTRRLYEQSFERLVQTGQMREGLAAKIALEQTKDTLRRMKNVEADGRIVIPFDHPEFPETGYNLVLENGDSLSIPKAHCTISVVGHVFRPISLVINGEMDVPDALESAGGLTEFADNRLLYIVRADGSVENLKSKGKRSKLLAGDVLMVPRAPVERTLGAELSDAISLLRHAAETAVIGSQIGKDVDMTLVSPTTGRGSGINGELLLDGKF